LSVMRKFFNTAGPCNPSHHFMIDPLGRLQGVEELIEQHSFFVLHAPRQSGKTTYLRSLAAKFQRENNYAAVVMSCEIGQPFRSDIDKMELVLLQSLRMSIEGQLPKDL
jgi:predicted AAA+ superfamily ATPase